MLLTTITPTIPKYICKLLKLRLLIQFYQKLLDRPNITHIVEKITKLKYENLAFLISDSSGTCVILKTMIFVDNIKDT